MKRSISIVYLLFLFQLISCGEDIIMDVPPITIIHPNDIDISNEYFLQAWNYEDKKDFKLAIENYLLAINQYRNKEILINDVINSYDIYPNITFYINNKQDIILLKEKRELLKIKISFCINKIEQLKKNILSRKKNKK